MKEPSNLYGPNNRPLDSDPRRNLPIEIQSAVKIEVNTAMDSARDELRKGSWIKFGISAAVAAFFFFLGYLNLLDKAEVWTRTRVDQKMDEPMMQEATKRLMDSRIVPYVSNEVAVATQRIELLKQQLTEVEQARQILQDKLEFSALASSAQLYDRDAYDRLSSLSEGTNSIAVQARRILSDIHRRLEYDRLNSTVLVLIEQVGDKKYQGPFTSDEIAMKLRLAGLEAPANYIRDHKLKQFVPELVQAALTSKDLWEANRITFAISELTNEKFYPWSTEQLTNWWNRNKAAYTNWPYAALEAANGAYSGTRYSEALTNYQAVLSADPSADLSRASAIACALECSHEDLATNLFSHFADPNGRWFKWAQAKLTVSTGDVTTATLMLVALSTNYPTFKDYKPWEDLWRKIDWKMYDRLMDSTNMASKATTSQSTKPKP